MRKVADSKFLIVVFDDTRTWWNMNVPELSAYTYYADDPSTTFKGYGCKYGGSPGQTDGLLQGWGTFAHSTGNSIGGGQNSAISSRTHPSGKYGAHRSGVGWYHYGFIYVR